MSRSGHPHRYAQHWESHNHGGRFYDSAKDELRYWANTANGPMVAVPVETLYAAHEFRECDSMTVLLADEDGPLPKPALLHCRKQQGHRHAHFNGYISWTDAFAVDVETIVRLVATEEQP